MLDFVYHFSEELIALLVDTIPRLNKSKQNVIDFFRGCGVPNNYLNDLSIQLKNNKDSINKFEIARIVLKRVNECGDQGLTARREIIKRIVEFDSFDNLWANDQISARGFVAKVREYVNQRDYLTKIKQAHQADLNKEQVKRQQEEIERLAHLEKRREQKENLRRMFLSLSQQLNRTQRGTDLEKLLNDFFKYEEILVKESFTISGDHGEGIIQQIDGSVEVNKSLYLVEVKCWNKPLSPKDISQHVMRLFLRDASVRGIFISESGYTDAAIIDLHKVLSQRIIVIFSLKEIVVLLESDKSFSALLKEKVEQAQNDMKLSFDP